MRDRPSILIKVITIGICGILSGCPAAVKERAPSEGVRPVADGETGPAPSAAFNTAVNHAMFGRHQEAIAAYKKAISENPGDAMAHYGLGVVYILTGDYPAAMEESKVLRDVNGEMADKLYALSLEKELVDSEIMSREKEIRIRPDSSAAYFRLGMTYTDHGRYMEAVEAFKQASRISPNSARIYYEMGKAYSKLGNLQEATVAFNQAIGIRPEYAPAYYELGVAWSKLGNHHEARGAYERAISLEPNNTDAHYLLGVTYGKMRRPEKAIESFEEVIRIDPDYASAYYGLGVLYLSLGDAHRALEAQEILKELDGTRAEKLFTMIFPVAGGGG